METSICSQFLHSLAHTLTQSSPVSFLSYLAVLTFEILMGMGRQLMKLPNSVNRAALSLTFVTTKSPTHTPPPHTHHPHKVVVILQCSKIVFHVLTQMWMWNECDRCINLDAWTDGVVSWVTQLQLGTENKDIPLCMIRHIAVVENDARTYTQYVYILTGIQAETSVYPSF